MTPFTGCFINANLFDIGVVSLLSCFLYVVLDHSPQAGVMLSNKFGNLVYGHGRSQNHDIGFEQQGEPAVSPGPRNIDQSDTAITAIDTGYPSVYVSFMLEKIQMSPRFLFRIMDSTVCLTTSRTGKLAPLGKVHMNIQTLLVNIKTTLHNLPWGCQHQRGLDQFSIFHDLNLTRLKS